LAVARLVILQPVGRQPGLPERRRLDRRVGSLLPKGAAVPRAQHRNVRADRQGRQGRQTRHTRKRAGGWRGGGPGQASGTETEELGDLAKARRLRLADTVERIATAGGLRLSGTAERAAQARSLRRADTVERAGEAVLRQLRGAQLAATKRDRYRPAATQLALRARDRLAHYAGA
jgi:hypothetical protein